MSTVPRCSRPTARVSHDARGGTILPASAKVFLPAPAGLSALCSGLKFLPERACVVFWRSGRAIGRGAPMPENPEAAGRP